LRKTWLKFAVGGNRGFARQSVAFIQQRREEDRERKEKKRGREIEGGKWHRETK
jgi:hypothetical protein